MKALATAALAAILVTFSSGAPADAPKPAGAKPSSFAPRHTGRRVYGAPIQPPIFGPQKRAHDKATTKKKPAVKKVKKKKTTHKPAGQAPKPRGVVREAANG
jgi:hypothetical protein